MRRALGSGGHIEGLKTNCEVRGEEQVFTRRLEASHDPDKPSNGAHAMERSSTDVLAATTRRRLYSARRSALEEH